jgi:hypothetical protein
MCREGAEDRRAEGEPPTGIPGDMRSTVVTDHGVHAPIEVHLYGHFGGHVDDRQRPGGISYPALLDDEE